MSFWKFAVPAALACLACCLPAIAPFFAGSLLAGLGIAGYVESLELALVVLGIGLAGFWFLRHRRQIGRSCACGPENGCNTSNSCNTP